MAHDDPWAKPSKVRDESAERLLGEVLAAIRDLNSRQVELESALGTMVQRLADAVPRQEPLDLTPIVAAITQVQQRPIEVKAPKGGVDSQGMIDELRAMIHEVGIKPTQWDNLVERISDAVRPQGTMVLGGGGKEFRVKNAADNIINPATEETLQTVATGIGVTLASRMLAKKPATDYTLWLDTANTGHIYTLEAPTGTVASATGFRGIRITLDVLGNPVGAVETNVSATLTFDNRTTDPGWFI